MRILVFQHLSIEHPGVFRDFWRADGHEWTAIELDEGDTIPDLQAFDLLVAMGGPMDVWEEGEHPWLRAEKAAIRQWVVEMERPFLGICLGHQLLADALGGTVGAMSRPEVGLAEVTLTAAGATDPVLRSVGPRPLALHWHGAEVAQVPDGAVALASTELCACQAMRWGRHAYGIQCHIEITRDTVAEWGVIPAYRASLKATLGDGGAERLTEEVAAAIGGLETNARRINDAFMALAEAPAAKEALPR